MHLVYADLNCPFCFAMHERLSSVAKLDQMRWHLVQHAPQVQRASNSFKVLEQLRQEYLMVLQRAPDVQISNPGFVPNTKLANQYLAQLSIANPELATKLRCHWYRALWQRGEDISDPIVLADLAAELDINLPEPSNAALQLCQQWQQQWEQGDFDLRIPAVWRTGNEVMLGLQHDATVAQFLDHQSSLTQDDDFSCQYIPAHRVCTLLAEPLPNQLQQSLQSSSYRNQMFDSPQTLLSYLKQYSADLVLLDERHQQTLELCMALAIREDHEALPVIVFGHSGQRQQEESALRAGAQDYLDLKLQQRTAKHRIQLQINQHHRLITLANQARKDPLTGLLNKREFHHRMSRYWRESCRYKQPLAILMIDIDFFKRFNDCYGHPAGDDALIRVAASIANSSRGSDSLCGRFGGEEFAIVVKDCQTEQLETLAQQIQQRVAQLGIEHRDSEAHSQLTLSIGIALTQTHPDQHLEQLIKLADQTLYSAKANGRNQYLLAELQNPIYQNAS